MQTTMSKVLKSNIWMHFEKKDGQSSMCRYCHKIVKTSGNTTNLRTHVQNIHKSIYPKCVSGSGDKVFSLWGDHHKIVKEQWGKNKVNDKGDSAEISQYLRTPPLGRIKDNPFDIWKELENQYPTLFKIAEKYLIIMGTSVPSERLFSTTGNIITQKRNCLLGRNLHKLLFLNSVSKQPKLWE